ncbi:MAG TPA: low molecular weight phosphatase family protein [Chloroflexaceae bacterium]|nr:low molecular weight phosphatase family protein [Chloroflexaceae bacterium]
MSDVLVLIVGAADTGRAPMAAALLARLAAQGGLAWGVASAGVVGHDGDPAEPEARSALLTLGLDLEGHVARSLSDELAAAAAALVAVESGIARVLRARYPGRPTATLGELAGRARDIPDPFRMHLGAWLTYAGEIEALLRAGLPRLRRLVEGGPSAAAPPEPAGGAVEAAPAVVTPSPERLAAIGRAGRLLALAADLPGALDWAGARAQLEADLALLEAPLMGDDLARPYVALLRARLAGLPGAPAEGLARAMAAAVGRLRAPVAPADLEALARELG